MTLYPTGGGGGGGGVTSLTAGQGISVSGATGAVTVSQATFTLTDGQDYVAFADDDSSALIDLIDGGASHGSQILFGNGASPGNVHVIQAFLDAGGIITFYAHDGAPAFHVADNSPSGGATVSTQGNTLDDGSNNHLAAFLKSITIGSTTPAATGTTEGLNFITGAAPHHISLVPTADNTADYTITLPNANGTVALTGGAVAWSSLTAPATALSLTMPAADTTTFTLQQTTQTGFTWTSSTLTSGALAALGLTGSSSFSGTLLAITSTSTGATGTVNWNSIAISGTPSASGVVSRGLEIVMSGAGTTSTNVGLYLSAANATTANTALEIAAGQILSDAAQTWAVKSATASSLQITDGTNPYLVIDTRTTTSGVSAITFEGSAPTITSAAGVTFSGINDPAYTLTLTGTTTVTALNGLQHYIGQPTVTDSSAVTVTTASTLYIAGAPAVSGSATITNPYAIHVAAGAVNFAGGSVAFNPKTDATYGLGTSALRWNSVGVATEFDVWGAASDANPAVSIQNAYIGFGPGGASALDTFLNRGVSAHLLNMSSALGSQLQWNTSTGIQTKYANIATVQGGVPAEYASTGTTQVALQTTSTAILSYTPTASGLFLVVVSCAHTAATVAGTCVATCTDVGTNATTTETVTLTSAAPGVHQTVIFCFSAKTSVAIAITGTAATNNDILANAAIFAL